MTLTTHAIVGASLAQFFPSHPVVAFGVGFVSHFLLDGVTHRDYDLISFKKDESNHLNGFFVYDKKFIIDLAKISVDFLLGFAFVYALYIFQGTGDLLVATLAGAIGAVLPDALQFVYFNFRHQPITFLQKFHVRIQNETNSFCWGILSQFTAIVLAVSLALFFTR